MRPIKNLFVLKSFKIHRCECKRMNILNVAAAEGGNRRSFTWIDGWSLQVWVTKLVIEVCKLRSTHNSCQRFLIFLWLDKVCLLLRLHPGLWMNWPKKNIKNATADSESLLSVLWLTRCLQANEYFTPMYWIKTWLGQMCSATDPGSASYKGMSSAKSSACPLDLLDFLHFCFWLIDGEKKKDCSEKFAETSRPSNGSFWQRGRKTRYENELFAGLWTDRQKPGFIWCLHWCLAS